MNFYQVFEDTLSRHWDRTALFQRQQTLTFRDLGKLVRLLSNRFLEVGIGDRTKVAIMLSNTIGFVASFLALCRCKAIPVLFDYTGTNDELRLIFIESQCDVILTCQTHHPSILKELDGWTITASLVPIDFIEGESLVILLLDKKKYSDSVYKNIDCKNQALLQFTSGTTGTPKCVVRTHENLINTAINFVSTIGYQSTDRIVCTTPFHHAYALNTCLLSSIYIGAELILPEGFNPIEILRIIGEQRVSVLVSIPYLYRFLTIFRPNNKLSIYPLRLCISGGGVSLSADIAKAFMERFNLLPIQVYGSTETAEITIHKELPHENGLSNGIPLSNVELKVVASDGKDVAVYETGEIVVRSKAVFPGYNHASNKNISAFKDGWYYTGDFGFIDEKQRLNIIGRKRASISVSGKKVDPKEVENVLNSHPKVKKAVIVGHKDAIHGEILKAIVITKKKCRSTDLIKFCQKQLSPHKIPKIFDFREHLPMSATGKIQLKKLIDLPKL
ncbi:MAG: class I adenylate-forming enzyme family protein [Desulfobacteraceae bacterium]|jgi:long-chain acyl-CoA synthetase